jgi:hypothetical protein
MKQLTRYWSFDIFRGSAIAYVIFIHGVIYNLRSLNQLDIQSLSPLVIALGMIGLWGGVFVVYSLVLNTMMVLRRLDQKASLKRATGFLVAAGAVYIGLIGSAQSLIFGRWPLDGGEFGYYTYIAEVLRGVDATLHLYNLMGSSGIKTIGLGLLVVSLVLMIVLKERQTTSKRDFHLLFLSLGLIVLVFSFLRIYLYEGWLIATAEQQWLIGYIGGIFLADPYPGIAYISYGFFGAALAIVLHYRRTEYLRRYVLPLSGVLMSVGTVGMLSQPLQLFGASWFWYFKILLESGFFLLLFSGLVVLALHENKLRKRLKNKQRKLTLLSPLLALSRISLTAYLLEMVTSEMLRHVWSTFSSDWDKTLLGCATLAVANVLVWLGIALCWKRANYKYSLEYFWVKAFAKFGKQSTKLDVANAV